MSKNLSIPLLLVCGNHFTKDTLFAQLKSIFPQTITIIPFVIQDNISPAPGNYFAVFSSKEVCDNFFSHHYGISLEAFISGERTMLNENIDQILSLPRNKKILLVNDSEKSAKEALAYLKKIQFDFLDLELYYPGCPLPDQKINIAITPGEIEKVPPGIESVYNIGSRCFDFITILHISAYYGLLEEIVPAYADHYFNSLLQFAKKVSNVVDEASQVLTTVRTNLIGTGYYAKYRFSDIVGQSKELLNVKFITEKIAKTDLNVLIEGENGTGKELFACAIHNASNRSGHPFVAINLSTLPDQLIESELFGYEEGAFTGARKKGKIGLFQQASGGTIFLDEIGDISPKIQVKLLRVLQEREIMRVGGDRVIPIDVRIIAATNQDLVQMIEEKTFRKDLYYRLKESYIKLPSLNVRKTDIPLLIEYWQQNKIIGSKKIDSDAIQLLMSYDWPGNIRELLNLMKFVSAVSNNNVITVSDIELFSSKKSQNAHSCVAEDTLLPTAAKKRDYVLDHDSSVVLSCAIEMQKEGGLIGRTSMLRYLKKKNISLTEYKIRKCIYKLLDLGLMRTENGRYGLSISPEAYQLLAERTSEFSRKTEK